MLRFFSFVILLGVSLSSMCQDLSTLSGKISAANGDGIPGVTVHLLNTNFGAATDVDGNFAIDRIPTGNYRLGVSAIGFASVEKAVVINQQSQILNLTLAEATTQLDAVVVTAQKTEEEVQKVPFGMSAIPSRQVLEYRIWNSKDVTAISPNLYSANPGDGRNVTSIRGIATTSYDPTVATYIDGVNQFGLDTYIAQLSDIERIEVLRGPQGTLYGRNAMGGVINIITKQPTNHTSGFGEINVGSHGQQRYSAGVRLPLVRNKLFLGLSGMYDRTDGFYTNVFDNSHFDEKSSVLGNYYLKYIASPSWAFIANVKHNTNRNNGTFPLESSVDAAFANPFTVNQNAAATMVDKTFNASVAANYVGHSFNFSSQTTYQSNSRLYEDPLDGDFSPIDGVTIINDYGSNWNKVEAVTQEFKFTSPANNASPLQWTLGSYLFYQNNPVKQATHFGNDAQYIDPDAMANTSILTTATGKGSGIAFFGQVDYKLSDRLTLIAGLRYDYEHKEQSVLGEFYMDGNPDPVFVTRSDTSATTNFKAFSPKAGLAYQANENSNLYITYSRGFRAGGLTAISPDPSQPPLYAYKPEFSNNFEAGIKNMFLDNRLKVNFDAFYLESTNVQVPTLILPEGFTITKNSGALDSYGVELETSTMLIKNLQIDYNFGYTHATFKTLDVPENGSEVDLSGNWQLFSPEFTSMLAVQYSIGLSASGRYKFIIRGEWQSLGTQYFDLANNIEQKPYSLLNTRLGFAGDGFELMVWGRNLTDEKYISYAYNFGATHLGDPKNWGVTLRKNF